MAASAVVGDMLGDADEVDVVVDTEPTPNATDGSHSTRVA
jgi:hypothetical protein